MSERHSQSIAGSTLRSPGRGGVGTIVCSVKAGFRSLTRIPAEIASFALKRFFELARLDGYINRLYVSRCRSFISRLNNVALLRDAYMDA